MKKLFFLLGVFMFMLFGNINAEKTKIFTPEQIKTSINLQSVDMHINVMSFKIQEFKIINVEMFKIGGVFEDNLKYPIFKERFIYNNQNTISKMSQYKRTYKSKVITIYSNININKGVNYNSIKQKKIDYSELGYSLKE